MNLVGYSDSESDDDGKALPPPKSIASTAPKPSFQKVIDRANPRKIKVNLPSTSQSISANDLETDAPPAKKAKLGGGAFGGFNALLPAPKKSGTTTGGIGSKGLGRGVNLRTGAAPAFSRESAEEYTAPQISSEDVAEKSTGNGDDAVPEDVQPEAPLKEEVKLVGKATRFMPMSVARKAQKKKKASTGKTVLQSTGDAKNPSTVSADSKPPSKPKVSLFSISQAGEEDVSDPVAAEDTYVPLFAGARQDEANDIFEEDYNPDTGGFREQSASSSTPASGGQSLDVIAADLNLSESARRQLFGRQRGKDLSAVNIVNFNTDAEYAANEELRAKGETVQHNPVKAIAPGKHSLQQLVNSASNQREALEEHFAKGRRNKREAGTKYGW